MTTSAPVEAERARLAALHRYGVLDTPREPSFDRLVRLAARVMGTPIAAISFVDADRVWFKAEVGLGDAGVPRSIALCAITIDTAADYYEVPDTRAVPSLAGNPLLAPPLATRFYACAALVTPDGFRIGTLCVIDRQPRPGLAPTQRATLGDLAATVMTELERRRQQALQERASARLAVLNDILAAVGGAAGFVGAIEAAMRRLCLHTGAAQAQLWEQAEGGSARLVAFAAEPPLPADRLQHLFAEFPALARATELTQLLAGDAPVLAPAITAEDVAHLPLLRAAHAEGMRAYLVHKLPVGAARYALVLHFAAARDDLPEVAALLNETGHAIRPALLRKQADERLALLNDVLAVIAGTPGFIAGIERAMALLCRHTGAFIGLFWDLAEQGTMVRQLAMAGPTELAAELRARAFGAFPMPVEKSLLGPVLAAGGRIAMRSIPAALREQYPLLRLAAGLSMRSFAAQAFAVGEARFMLILCFAAERDDLDALGDLLGEMAQAIRPAVLRRQAEAQLALWRAAADATADGIVVTAAASGAPADQRVVQVNPAFCRMTGYAAAEALGRNMRFLQGRGTDPASIARLREAVGARRAERVELLNYRRDGTPFWVEVGIAPITDEHGNAENFVGVLRDTSERHATQESLQRLAAELQERTGQLTEVARLARVGSWAWRAGGGEMRWSEETFLLLGVARGGGAPTVETFLALLHPEDAQRARHAAWQAIQSGQDLNLEVRVPQPGGRLRTLIWSGSARRGPDGALTELRGYCQDVTERRETEAALRHGEKLRALGELTGGIAHEFSNLLTVVQANLEMALDESEQLADARPELEAARRAAQAGAELTSRLLSFARSEPLRSERTDVNAWLGPLQEMARRTLGQRYQVTLRADPALPAVAVDRSQLEGALLNLILNARDAMPSGGAIVLQTERIEVPPGARGALADLLPGGYAVIGVHDGGAGMPAEVLERAFEPFFTTKPTGRGTGLGLSMVLGFARQSGGTALLASRPGRGTAVRILLPLG